MNLSLADFTERLIPISDFSQGKAGKIFSDVSENNREYIVLKNNQPTAVILSVKEYRDIQNKLAKLENLFEKIENCRLHSIAMSRNKSDCSDFEEYLSEEGLNINELSTLANEVEPEF